MRSWLAVLCAVALLVGAAARSQQGHRGQPGQPEAADAPSADAAPVAVTGEAVGEPTANAAAAPNPPPLADADSDDDGGNGAAPANGTPANDADTEDDERRQREHAAMQQSVAVIAQENLSWLDDAQRRAQMALQYPQRGSQVRRAIGILRYAEFRALPDAERRSRTLAAATQRVGELANDPGVNDNREIGDEGPITPPRRGQAELTRIRAARARARQELVNLLRVVDPQWQPTQQPANAGGGGGGGGGGALQPAVPATEPTPRQRTAWRQLENIVADLKLNDVNVTIRDGERELRDLLTALGAQPGDWRRQTILSYLGIRYQSAHGSYSPPNRLLQVLFLTDFATGQERANRLDRRALTRFFDGIGTEAAMTQLHGLQGGGTISVTLGRQSLSHSVPAIPDAVWARIRERAMMDVVEGTASHRTVAPAAQNANAPAPPPPPQQQQQPANGGALPNEWRNVLVRWRRSSSSTLWRVAVNRNPETVQLDRVVCNELSEIAQSHRGNRLAGGIQGAARTYYRDRASVNGAFFVAGPQVTPAQLLAGATIFFVNNRWVRNAPSADAAVRLPDNIPIPEPEEPAPPAAAPANTQPAAQQQAQVAATPQPASDASGTWHVDRSGAVTRWRQLADGTRETQHMVWLHEATIAFPIVRSGETEPREVVVLETTDRQFGARSQAAHSAASGLTLHSLNAMRSPFRYLAYAPPNSNPAPNQRH